MPDLPHTSAPMLMRGTPLSDPADIQAVFASLAVMRADARCLRHRQQASLLLQAGGAFVLGGNLHQVWCGARQLAALLLRAWKA